ncbi:hypothetical protein AAZX31_01G179300 [Glycine max]
MITGLMQRELKLLNTGAMHNTMVNVEAKWSGAQWCPLGLLGLHVVKLGCE